MDKRVIQMGTKILSPETCRSGDTLILKGFIGSEAQNTVLPSVYKRGWTYIVESSGALKSYAGTLVDVGDHLVATTDSDGDGNKDEDWIVVAGRWPRSPEYEEEEARLLIAALNDRAQLKRDERKKNV